MRKLARIVIAGTLLLVVFTAGLRLGGNPLSLPAPLRALAGSSSETAFNQAARLIKDDYYRPIPESQIQNRGIDGLVDSLHDRFSAYLDPTEYKVFKHSQNPHFSGIGLDVQFAPRGLAITRVFPGTPAEKAGIKAGETIVSVDGKSIAGKKVAQSVALVTGKPGTLVRVGVVDKNGTPRVVSVRRATITVPSVETKLITAPNGKKVGVVALSGFVQGAGAQVSTSTKSLVKRGAQAIVLDLRDNGGGLLDEGVSVASVFIPKGTIVVTKGRAREREVYAATGGSISTKIPVVVLVNRNSASASEIVTGAIKDTKRGIVVGTQTFGKGVFQEITELTNGGALDITVGEYFTPSGRNLGGGGVKTGAGIAPDVAVPSKAGSAAALQRAVAAAAGEAK